ncbi:PhzF family phenazine biosynthesis protein [Corynebacterium flavescens]|uniref:PhzF family phenazine biosynthesis protein n=1 Tax=Corynebacterium flavescens TaxID=28028 RepID=UPI002649128D|nr:PhzF family phenazine biosynthesis protein [Corynebacterium flavescens]MDN6431983.1 PhzF family phenazine biosynthesis protein [Corynebacterium flavescens]MDN6475446.1 PhzF family phenazine biosynthesis protein [Corynebacterium flavescens]MDN6532149.1 PhzF family phenazine biosynthesis protein [Corynebacterium flavescens]MDN6601810.1 PhzF family phenazine biosynthesis protein [Corynebacterium flavescens]MDN6687835.1 PhzF family phenazine biosynthesis protein [Corynebacterium flavescens]
MPKSHPFAQVDVFSQSLYQGNPLTVILEAEDLSDSDLQKIARWTNLSETTFLLPPTQEGADYRVRIFTPRGELLFAGHPTLGSAHAWLEHHGDSRDKEVLVQECAAGLIKIRRGEGILSFAAPATQRSGDLNEDFLATIARAFGIERQDIAAHQWVDNGPGWAVVQLPTAQQVLDLQPDLSLIPDAMVGAIGAYPAGSEFDFEMRTFAPRAGVAEDPVCGSMNASVGQWLIRSGRVDGAYRVSQGSLLGRAGDITITPDEMGTVWVGGATNTLFRGTALA